MRLRKFRERQNGAEKKVHEQDQSGDHCDQRPDRAVVPDQEERNAGENKILVWHERQARYEQLQCGEEEQRAHGHGRQGAVPAASGRS